MLLTPATLQRLTKREIPICILFNRAIRYAMLKRLFIIVSRLGNGVFWYTLMLLLPLIYGKAGGKVGFLMAITGVLNLLIYRSLKTTTLRERPFECEGSISLGTAPLDKYSFPSGHTMHAIGFSVVLLAYYPIWAWIVGPFCILVALSRVTLGLHYPSDVFVGAILGGSIASLVLHAASMV